MKKTTGLLVLAAFLAAPLSASAETAQPAAPAPQGGSRDAAVSPRAQREAEKQLAAARAAMVRTDATLKRWEDAKKQYADSLDADSKELEARFADIQKALDEGDPKLRAELNEAANDMRRQREHVSRVKTQLTATFLVRLANLRSEMKENIEDMKD